MDRADEVDGMDLGAVAKRDGSARGQAGAGQVRAKKNRAEERRERKSEITPALLKCVASQ